MNLCVTLEVFIVDWLVIEAHDLHLVAGHHVSRLQTKNALLGLREMGLRLLKIIVLVEWLPAVLKDLRALVPSEERLLVLGVQALLSIKCSRLAQHRNIIVHVFTRARPVQ